jgi:ABC-type polysaccharide/polyol phosphate transport system ATPase subunit
MISVVNISKKFKIPHERSKTLFHKLTGVFKSQYLYEEFFALNEITFKINGGEFLGIIGRNGSGKTTLLRIIAGIYRPTTGTVTVEDEITPFLELGIGFQGDFSCRENIYINGALLGFSRREMDSRFKQIMEFSELEKFADIKLNKLSAGMQIRLAFSIAMQSTAPILLVDEIFAVGDSNFQQKCRDVFREYKKNGRTVLFVSHDMNSIQEYCNRVLVLEQGKIVKEGSASGMINYYHENILAK